MVKQIFHFLKDIFDKRRIIGELVKRDFQQQYMGSYLGVVWVFLQPLLFILVLYTVFTLGFRAGISDEMPFSLYLVSGMVCWIYFSKNLGANTEVISKYSFLVKKVNFRLSVLPIVTLTSSTLPHLFLLGVAILLSWQQGYPPSLYTLQVIYYFFAMFMLLLGLAWLTSSCSLFVKDVSNVISVVTQFGFWLTPVFWNIKMIPDEYHWIIELNPMYYIISGYRDSIVMQQAFWERDGALYFWAFTAVTMLIGITVFRRLKPHFAEVV